MRLSVIIPTLNAATILPATLASVIAAAPGRDGPPIIVVDGGSTDATRRIAARLGARVIAAPPGRGVQLAAGVAAAVTAWLLLLHADTRLEPGWLAAAEAFMAAPANSARAGFFRFALASADPRARRLERLVAWRCRRLGLPYGDQGLLIARATLDAVGGIRPLPLMEDVDLARRLGRRRLVALSPRAVTSAARWEQGGWYRRSARNLACLGLWYAGVPPRLLVRLYA
jgi:rSAM/selenodomain-associated transferase 2